MRQLALMTDWLPHQHTRAAALSYESTRRREGLVGVLRQCRELVHLNHSLNNIGAGGTERLGELVQCTVLVHLNLSENGIVDVGTESLAAGQRVLQECWQSAQR